MDEPKRKRMRLPGYDYSRPGAYFVTVCTRERKCILSHIAVGADAFGGPSVTFTDAGRIVEKHLLTTDRINGLHVEKYVIMPNHVHAIIQLTHKHDPVTVSSVVNAWKSIVKQKTAELVWQKSFHDHIIRDEKDYLRIWKYIDDNPIKWADDFYYVPSEDHRAAEAGARVCAPTGAAEDHRAAEAGARVCAPTGASETGARVCAPTGAAETGAEEVR